MTKHGCLVGVTPLCDNGVMSNAPGKSFRKGISLIEIVELFPDDAMAEAWFEERRWHGWPCRD